MTSSIDRSHEQPTDELGKIQTQINQTTNESLEATRRMATLAVETREVGVETLVMLDEQGEKLNRIETGLDQIHVNMGAAEKNLTDLKKCCGCCILPWNRVRYREKKYKEYTRATPTKPSSNIVTTEPKARGNPTGGTTAVTSNNYVNRITHDDRETEMENNLQIVGDVVGNLKNMALDMNKKVQDQNVQIGSITRKADFENGRVTAADNVAKSILRNS